MKVVEIIVQAMVYKLFTSLWNLLTMILSTMSMVLTIASGGKNTQKTKILDNSSLSNSCHLLSVIEDYTLPKLKLIIKLTTLLKK